MYAKHIKRILDFILSLTALIVLSPILFLLTVIGTVVMRGNPFFVQERPGRINPKTGQERIMPLIKFRTMSNRCDTNGTPLPDEMRLTRYGNFLRSTSLDELPSIINILTGDLAIVGPRPLLVRYLPYYTAEERHRHDVRPGLTGLAQVNGRNYLSWEQKFAYDLEYIRKCSFALDVQIVIRTALAAVKRSNVETASIIVHEGKIYQPLDWERGAETEEKINADIYRPAGFESH